MIRQRVPWIAIVILFLASARLFEDDWTVRVSADDWPTIRGPFWDGHSRESGIADSWPTEGPPVLWTRELGQGYSSFIAWGDRVATQYQSLAGQYLICLEADTGKTLWEYRYAWPYLPAGVYPGPRSTPVYDSGCIYFTSPDGLVACLDADDGRLRWSLQLAQHFSTEVPGFGYSSCPVVVDDKVIIPLGGRGLGGRGSSLVALDKATGEVVWNRGDDPASYASVLPIAIEGRRCVVGYLQNALVFHDLASGEALGRISLSSGYDEHSSWPIYREPYLWIAGPFQGGSQLLELRLDSPSIKVVRSSKTLSNDIFSSVLHDGALFGFDLHEAQAKTHRTSRGIFRCVDFRGGEILWSVGNGRLPRDPRSASSSTSDGASPAPEPTAPKTLIGHATVIVADNKLLLMNDLGELILAKADRREYVELARAAVLTGEICWTQPALSRGRLFVRNQSRAACVYIGRREDLSDSALENALPLSQVPQTSYRDIAGLLLGVEPEYLFDLPSMDWFRRWFAWSMLAILGGPLAFVVLLGCIVRWPFRQPKQPIFQWRLGDTALYWTLAFLGGAIGTTVLSSWTQDFVFTWPVCLFVVWQLAIDHASVGKPGAATGYTPPLARWRSRLVALGLVAVWGGYFLLCRRLSLVLEWAFLTGFAGALPFSLAAKLSFANGWLGTLWRPAMIAAAFAAFYWSSVGLLLWRYA